MLSSPRAGSLDKQKEAVGGWYCKAGERASKGARVEEWVLRVRDGANDERTADYLK